MDVTLCIWEITIGKKTLHSNSTQFSDLGGHALAAALFGYGGYLAYKWDVRSGELLQDRRREIEERRAARAEAASE
jgi:hypothetical protein